MQPTAALDKLEFIAKNLRKFELDIAAALCYSNGSHTFDDICLGVLRGELDFYPLTASFVIMQVMHTPQYMVYHCLLAGGKMNEVLDSIEPISQIAKARGCRYLSFEGRAGWERVLSPLGWGMKTTYMMKEVK